MNFFNNDDDDFLRLAVAAFVATIIILGGIGIFGYLRDLHDERMADKGCTEVIICNNGEKHWECEKDK